MGTAAVPTRAALPEFLGTLLAPEQAQKMETVQRDNTLLKAEQLVDLEEDINDVRSCMVEECEDARRELQKCAFWQARTNRTSPPPPRRRSSPPPRSSGAIIVDQQPGWADEAAEMEALGRCVCDNGVDSGAELCQKFFLRHLDKKGGGMFKNPLASRLALVLALQLKRGSGEGIPACTLSSIREFSPLKMSVKEWVCGNCKGGLWSNVSGERYFKEIWEVARRRKTEFDKAHASELKGRSDGSDGSFGDSEKEGKEWFRMV